jgi:integrase
VKLEKLRDAEARSDQVLSESRGHAQSHSDPSRDEREEARLQERDREKYMDRDKSYSLRPSEIHTLTEVGKFRVVSVEDIAKFAYLGNRPHMENDLRNLKEQGLIVERATSVLLNKKAERYAPSVLHHIRATMSRVCSSAKEWGYLESNPSAGIRLPQRHCVQPKVTFQPEDLQIVLAHLEEPHRTLVLLIAVTGMRVSELLGLQWSDVDLERRLLHIRRTFYRGNFGLPKTHCSERVIPISDGLSYALQQHRQHVRISAMNLVFPNADGKPYEAANLLHRVLHPVLAKCGLPRTGWRVFRRSVATALSEMREPVRTTQQVLGHASPHTTLLFYTQSVEDSQRNAISRLERILFPNVPKFEQGLTLTY